MKYQRWLTFLLALCILLSALPMTALAEDMVASELLIQFIKDNEGFAAQKYWDVSQFSIGYGSRCEEWEYPDGITPEEADALMRQYIKSAEANVDGFVRRNGLHPTQQQYDVMVTLTYGLGSGWMRDIYTLPKLLARDCTELELLNCMGDWVSAGGVTLDGLIYRRMRENYIYFHGEYNRTDSIADDVPYACVKLDPVGGSVAYRRVYTFRGKPYGLEVTLPTPSRNGYEFLGWYDAKGNRITEATIAQSVLMTATARWEESERIYSDVRGTDWFYADVKRATELSLFNGYADGTFRPNDTMTRAMFAQVLYNMEEKPTAEGGVPFTDVSPQAWYFDAVHWAYQQGIVNGMSPTSFAPDSKITREQMATMLFKYGSASGLVDSSRSGSLEGYQDADQVSAYALEPMQWAVGVGLINGMSATKLAPKNDATRAQAAAILVRLTGLSQKSVA